MTVDVDVGDHKGVDWRATSGICLAAGKRAVTGMRIHINIAVCVADNDVIQMTAGESSRSHALMNVAHLRRQRIDSWLGE